MLVIKIWCLSEFLIRPDPFTDHHRTFDARSRCAESQSLFHFTLFLFLFLFVKEETAMAAATLFAGMEAGWLRPVIGPEYSLDKAAQAHEDIINSSGASGKMILTMWNLINPVPNLRGFSFWSNLMRIHKCPDWSRSLFCDIAVVFDHQKWLW